MTTTASANRKTSVAVLSNSTLQPFCVALKKQLTNSQTTAAIWECPFDQWHTQLLDADSELYSANPAFLVLYLSSLGLTRAATADYSIEIVEQLATSLQKFKSISSARILCILPEPLEEELFSSSRFFRQRHDFIDQMLRRLGSDVIFIDPQQVALSEPQTPWRASRFWYHAKLPLHPSALNSLASAVATTITHCFAAPIKVIACDLDDTLWGGVLGEDGWQNVQLDLHAGGGPFLRLQAFLKDLVTKGVVLVAVSKNNEADVRELFSKREEMLLAWDDFAVVCANWEPKSHNLRAIAANLNLDLGHFCFIDNSSFEREEVRKSLPQVLVPELPANPEDYVPFLVRSGLFHVPITTEEDKNRSQLYKADFARAESSKHFSDHDSFLRSLELSATAQPINSNNLERVVQLINKTNQFNLTTQRYDTAQVKTLCERTDVFAYCYRVSDKFGDHGLTGVLIATPLQGRAQEYQIDTWLLSCRVMGRTIERAMFEHLTRWLSSKSLSLVHAQYIPSAKNAPVSKLLPQLGFEGKEQTLMTYKLNPFYQGNTFVRLIEQKI